MAMPAPAKPADAMGSMPGMANKPADPHAGMAGMGGMADMPGMPGMGAASPTLQADADGLRRLKYAHLRALTRNAVTTREGSAGPLTGDMALLLGHQRQRSCRRPSRSRWGWDSAFRSSSSMRP
jgi:hypothetical protein